MAYTKAGIRFSKDSYVTVDASGGGGIERKLLWENPDPSQEMDGSTMFEESELEGYTYIAFTVATTGGNVITEEWCEIEPLKAAGGQFIVSQPHNGKLYGRKIYRSSGAVKASTAVYELGKTIEDRSTCIVTKVEAVKIG